MLRITGSIDGVYEREFIAYTVSKYPLKYKIEAYLKALLLCEAGKIDSACFIDKEGNISLIPADSKSAKSMLEELLLYFIEGSKSPLLLTIKAVEKAKELEEKARKESENAAKGKPDSRKSKEEMEEKDLFIEVFKNESFPEENSKMPANLYLRALFYENYFDEFGGKEIEVIRELSDKLNLFEF